MGVLSPKAAIEHWNRCLEEARRSPEWFKMKNSQEFIRRVNVEWDHLFGQKREEE